MITAEEARGAVEKLTSPTYNDIALATREKMEEFLEYRIKKAVSKGLLEITILPGDVDRRSQFPYNFATMEALVAILNHHGYKAETRSYAYTDIAIEVNWKPEEPTKKRRFLKGVVV